MKKTLAPVSIRQPFTRQAFTLIEMIGVLAVVAVLAAVLLPALIKQTDKTVSDQENLALQSLGTALQNNILRNHRIPADGAGPDWATNIAIEAGLGLADVTNNFRRQPRVFLIDTNGFGKVSLPYTQTSSGTTNQPTNPRFMILSSLGKTLPTLNSRLATAEFNNLWNSTTTSFPTTGAWAGWNGKPEDVVIQRLNISPLFVQLVLTANNSGNYGRYKIDSGTSNLVTTSSGLNAYYLQNSVLTLSSTNVIDSEQILQGNVSFVYDQNVWRSSITSLSTSNDPPDYSRIADAFATAGPNGVDPSTSSVLTDFNNYMTAYNAWANAGFPNNSLKTAALSAYTTMMNDVNNLVDAVQP